MAGPVIRRGEVWWIAFSGGVGGEIQKTRPAVIVSNNRSNEMLNRVQVVPLTTKIRKIYPGEALVTLQGQSRKVMANQIQTVDKLRCRSCIGSLGDHDMQGVERSIIFQLGLSSLMPR